MFSDKNGAAATYHVIQHIETRGALQ